MPLTSRLLCFKHQWQFTEVIAFFPLLCWFRFHGADRESFEPVLRCQPTLWRAVALHGMGVSAGLAGVLAALFPVWIVAVSFVLLGTVLPVWGVAVWRAVLGLFRPWGGAEASRFWLPV